MALSFREARQYTDRNVFASLAAIMLVALVAAAGVIYCVRDLLQARQESIQITKIQAQLSTFYIELLNAETGQRGYLLTGDEAYLQPYEAARRRLAQEGPLLVDQSRNYSYARAIQRTRSLAQDKLSELDSTITIARNGNPEAALAIVRTGRGQREMDQIRALMADIASRQATELVAKRATATRSGAWAYGIAITMLIVVGALAVLVYYLFLQAIKAERALDRAKGEFVSLASHQLRTPATGIKSILSLLQSGDMGPLTPRQHHLVERAIESNERGLRVVEELLNVARADAGRLELHPVKLDLGRLVEAAVTEQRPLLEAKHQTVRVHQPKQAMAVQGDEEKLYMAIANLLDNASKYTPKGGAIQIRLHQRPRAVVLEVEDNGIGMDKNQTANIFDRFQRAHDLIASGADGTGLGLYLVRHIAQLHHGDIKVKSKVGEGSTFTLTLPRKDRTHAA